MHMPKKGDLLNMTLAKYIKLGSIKTEQHVNSILLELVNNAKEYNLIGLSSEKLVSFIKLASLLTTEGKLKSTARLFFCAQLLFDGKCGMGGPEDRNKKRDIVGYTLQIYISEKQEFFVTWNKSKGLQIIENKKIVEGKFENYISVAKWFNTKE